MIRPLAFRDMPLFNRYRKKGLDLDSIPMLTWGPGVLSAGAMLSAFSSLTGVFTYLIEKRDEAALIGQVLHHQDSPFAQLTFLAPIDQVPSNELSILLDQLIAQVSARGAHSIIAEVEESGPAFEALREAGFSIYARQGIWRFRRGKSSEKTNHNWRHAEEIDALSVKLLCGSLVPGIIQQVEPAPWNRLKGLVHYEQGELRAYVDLRKGPQGLWLQPFVHFDAQSFQQSFEQIVNELSPSRKRPLYVRIRSYQDQLEEMLKEMGAAMGPRQAVRVKRTDLRIKAKHRQAIIEGNGRRAEPSAPIRLPVHRAALEMELKEYD